MGAGDRIAGLYGDAAVKTFTLRSTGSVLLFGPEIDLVSTPNFQRLDRIRQLGTAHIVFRSANHTRFEHSLGTLSEVQRIIEAVNRNPRGTRRIDATGQRLARMLALTHDVTHIPYGHTLEDEFGLLDRHDVNDSRRRRLIDDGPIGRILRKALEHRLVDDTNEYELLMLALSSNDKTAGEQLGRWAFIVDLVTNTVCADALDYISRDLTGCGMPVALGDRFLDYFVVTDESHPQLEHRSRMALRLDKRGMPRPDVASEVYKLLEHRYELVERVFFHHAKNSASAIISRAVQELGFHRSDAAFDELGDEALILAIRDPAIAEALGLPVVDDPAAVALAASLGEAVHYRSLYKLAYLGIPEDDVPRRAKRVRRLVGESPEERRQFEDELAVLCGMEPGQVLLHVPAPKMLAKSGRVRVILDNGDIEFLGEWDASRAQRLSALERAHERLWRVSVYAHPSASAAELRLVARAAEDRFELPARYVREAGANAAYFGELFDVHASNYGWPPHRRAEAIECAAEAAAHAEGGPANSRTRDAMVDLLDGAVRTVSRTGGRPDGQAPLFDENDLPR